MKRAQLSDMLRGWFIGDFSPTVLSTKDVEVGVKLYKAGDSEERHFHKIATKYDNIEINCWTIFIFCY